MIIENHTFNTLANAELFCKENGLCPNSIKELSDSDYGIPYWVVKKKRDG